MHRGRARSEEQQQSRGRPHSLSQPSRRASERSLAHARELAECTSPDLHSKARCGLGERALVPTRSSSLYSPLPPYQRSLLCTADLHRARSIRTLSLSLALGALALSFTPLVRTLRSIIATRCARSTASPVRLPIFFPREPRNHVERENDTGKPYVYLCIRTCVFVAYAWFLYCVYTRIRIEYNENRVKKKKFHLMHTSAGAHHNSHALGISRTPEKKKRESYFTLL